MFASLLKYKKHLLATCFALCGIGMSISAGLYQAEQEQKVQFTELLHEVDAAFSSVEKNFLKATEVGRFFQMASSSDLAEPETLFYHYNQITPQESIPGFKNVFLVAGSTQIVSSVPEAAGPLLMKNGWPTKSVLDSVLQSHKTGTPSWSFFPPQELMFLSMKSYVGKERSIVLGISPYVFFNKALALNRTTPFSMQVVLEDENAGNVSIYKSQEKIDSSKIFIKKYLNSGNLKLTLSFFKAQDFSYSLWPVATVFTGSLVFVFLSLFLFQMMTTKEEAEASAREMTKKFMWVDDKFKKINEDLPGLVMVLSSSGEILEINREGRHLVDKGFGGINKLILQKDFDRLFRSSLLSTDQSAHSVKIKTFFGEDIWISLSFSPIVLNERMSVLVLGSDISELMQMSQQLDVQNQKLHFLAVHDPLTNLFNRRAFEEKVDDFVFKNLPFSLLYIDLDQFKIVNDTAGHIAGDRLLSKISSVFREKTNPHFLARLGGDEFGIIVANDKDAAEKIAHNILNACQNFLFPWDDVSYKITTSIGLVHSDIVTKSLKNRRLNKEDMMSCADSACYISKHQGRNRVHIFSNDMESSLHRQEMEWTLRVQEAINENRVVLYKQAIKNIKEKGAVDHAEVLVRLIDPSGKVIQAADFIPAVERFGLMPILDKWIICSTIDHLSGLDLNEDHMFSINVSGQTLDDPMFDDFLADLVEKKLKNPKNLCIEITETAAIKNIDRMSDILSRSRSLGVRVALDDFGVGMSSFSYLKKFKADYIKIDGSFIRDIDTNSMSLSIVEAIVDLAHQFGIKVVAEFVGSQSVVDILTRIGVDFGQGFFYAEPELFFKKTLP